MKRTITTTRITLGLVLGLALWNAEPNLQAATLTVTNTNDSGGGSLRQAIVDAAPGDTINFSLSSCPCTITLTSGTLSIDKNLTIQGPGTQQLAVSGGGQTRVFVISNGVTATLDRLTIKDGNSSAGAGILISGTLTVSNSTVSNNSAPLGGGIGNSGTLTVSNSTVSYNSATSAGGIGNGGTLTVSNSTVSYNSATSAGGGIRNSGMLAVINSTVSNNSAVEFGGGIGNGGMLAVTNSTVSNNSAGRGGGIRNLSMLNVTNSTVSNNSAVEFGGGIANDGPSATINNAIVAGNVVGTTANDIYGLLTSGSHDLIGDTNSSGGLLDGTNGNIVGVDVNTVLEPLASNGGPTQTHKLLPNGPAVNAGENALAKDADNNALQYDQRGPGFPRISGGTVDIGAFEQQTYGFSGFLQPVANPPTVNSAKAGTAIPVKFSLGGYQGLDIFKPGYPASQPWACSNSTLNDVVQDPTATTGFSTVSYDPATDQYTYVWKTNPAWKNSCRKLVIQLNDGTTHEATFQFK